MTQDQDAPRIVAFNIVSLHQLKSGPGHVLKIDVQSAGTSPGFIHDSRTLGDSNSFTRIADIPNAIGVIEVDQKFNGGLVVQPGAEQKISVTFL